LCLQMLAYSGKGKLIVKLVNLSNMVDGMLQLLQTTMDKRVEIRMDLAPNLPLIEADEGQMQQVMMNLMINASEAIGKHTGLVEVQTRAVRLEVGDYANHPDFLVSEMLVAGEYVRLHVSDTGCGMDAETMKKIFDPFFTTKFTGRGLGMSGLLGIVRGHHGGLSLHSEVNQGTVFEVYFPVAKDQESAVVPSIAPQVNTKLPQGAVLVVDDEEVVRTLAALLLEDAGFEAILAKDGVEGLDLLHQHQQDIMLVLLDMTMPKMSGDEFYKHMRVFETDIPVLVSSGYAEQDIQARFDTNGAIAFIQKPYAPEAFAEKITLMLK
ncbi:MAG: response regulator, partial [Ghiorsea sp.]